MRAFSGRRFPSADHAQAGVHDDRGRTSARGGRSATPSLAPAATRWMLPSDAEGGPQMVTVSTEDPVAVAARTVIHTGDLAALRRLLAEHPWLATARLGDDEPGGMS